MKFDQVAIESMGYALPDEVWSSARIEEELDPLYQRLKLPQGRLQLMTGIEQRRFWSDPILPSQASALAGKDVLGKSQFAAEEMDVLIHCSVCRDRWEPATAAYVHQALALSKKAQFFDVSNACLGFLNAMIWAAGMIETGAVQRVLLVSGENGRPLVEKTLRTLLEGNLSRQEIKPYFANLTIGAGAVAAVLCHRDLLSKEREAYLQVQAAAVCSDSSHNHLCEGDQSSGDGLDMQTDSEELLEAGVTLAQETWADFKAVTGWTEQTPQRVITHQVGSTHRRKLYEALGLDLELDYSSFAQLGNVGSVSLPITLAMAMEEGKVQPEDLVALLGIGSGLSSAMMALQYCRRM